MTAVKLKTYRWYITRGKTLWRQGKKRQALKMWGKAGALKKRMRFKRYDFLATMRYQTPKGREKGRHDFYVEIAGTAIARSPDEVAEMLKQAIREEGEDMSFISCAQITDIGITREEPAPEAKKSQIVNWDIRKFKHI